MMRADGDTGRPRRRGGRLAAITVIAAAVGGAFGIRAGAGTEPSAAAPAATSCCAIVELRQYTLHPDRFDAFTELFENEFVEPLEAAGMTVIGQFHDLDDPNRFVWLRGFADMPARARSLEAFYDGPLWKSRRDAANENFTDTDNVLLLHPATAQSGVRLDGLVRPDKGAPAGDRGLVVVTVYSLDAAQARTFPAYFDHDLKPALAHAGIDVAAAFETETSANNFPRLPVREGEHVFVWIARFADRQRGEAALDAIAHSQHWREHVAPGLQRRLKEPARTLRLAPTARSLLRG